jgi:hypothetical protein
MNMNMNMNMNINLWNKNWNLNMNSCSDGSRQTVVPLRHAVLAVAKFARLLGCIRDVCFLSKKAVKW